jgi:predicted MFS family arabinose efflux permease
MVQWGWQAQTGWLIFGVLAFALTAGVWRTFRSAPVAGLAAAPATIAAAGAARGRSEIGCLAFAYGLAGFGYIVTATFLPVIARQAMPGSAWLDMFWPIFGAGVMIGALLATRLRATLDMRLLLAGCYLVQAAGIVVGVWSPSLAGFAIGSLLLGIPFTAITFFAMQEVRRLRPLLAASFMGLMTALYGLGQIAGPPMVALILRHSASTGEGFTLALEVAAGGLLVGALMYLAMWRAWPGAPKA